jgi:hypothetical protein
VITGAGEAHSLEIFLCLLDQPSEPAQWDLYLITVIDREHQTTVVSTEDPRSVFVVLQQFNIESKIVFRIVRDFG